MRTFKLMRVASFQAIFEWCMVITDPQKDVTIATIETNIIRSPSISLRGRLARNSSAENLEVSIDVKRTMESDEHMKATPAAMKKISNQLFSPKTGNPSLLNPPGTLIATPNAKVEINVATIMQVVEVSFNHFSPYLRRVLCSLANITSGDSPVLLLVYARGTIFFKTLNTQKYIY